MISLVGIRNFTVVYHVAASYKLLKMTELTHCVLNVLRHAYFHVCTCHVQCLVVLCCLRVSALFVNSTDEPDIFK